MILWTLLVLSIGADMRTAPLQAAEDWHTPDMILPAPAIGQVPLLAPTPPGLPEAQNLPDGGVLIPFPRSRYVAAQVSSLYRYPPLAQRALDEAVKSERDICTLKLMDERAAQPTLWDRVRTDALWAVVGAVAGGVAAVWLLR
jgi:hypothetical protein